MHDTLVVTGAVVACIAVTAGFVFVAHRFERITHALERSFRVPTGDGSVPAVRAADGPDLDHGTVSYSTSVEQASGDVTSNFGRAA